MLRSVYIWFDNIDGKGIAKTVSFDGKELTDWQEYSLPFNDIHSVRFSNYVQQGNAPVVRKGFFDLDSIADTYLDMTNWGKGVVWVNGHNLGRYWYTGPQQTIYLPAEWLKKGMNEIEVLELLKPEQKVLRSIKAPILDELHSLN